MGWWSRYCLLVVVMLVSAAIVHGLCTNPDPCIPDCTGCDLNEKVADPANCRQYYECDGSGDYLFTLPLQCPSGQVYSVDDHDCVEGDSCDQCPPVCLYECVLDLIDQPFFYSCRQYYDCSLGIERDCDAATPFFDGTSCQTDETRCCHCRPYCFGTDVGTLITDPRDCRNYYACEVQGPPTNSGTCPEGQFFSELTQDCSSLVACSTSPGCHNVLGEDGCIEPFTCLDVGYFPKCPGQCSAEYFYCPEDTWGFQDPESCPNGTVFHPDNHVCISADQCP